MPVIPGSGPAVERNGEVAIHGRDAGERMRAPGFPGHARRMSPSRRRTVGRVLLGGMLVLAGTGHLTFARKAFRAQVPPWVPVDVDTTVLASGVVEIGLGTALLAAPPGRRRLVGIVAALFFAAVFPGNLSQFAERRDAFGLDTDGKRFARLFGQPLLIALALWSTRRGRT